MTIDAWVAVAVITMVAFCLVAVFGGLMKIDEHYNKQTPEERYWFAPRQDITAYELADILRRCQSPHIGPTYQRLPKELKRHFVKA